MPRRPSERIAPSSTAAAFASLTRNLLESTALISRTLSRPPRRGEESLDGISDGSGISGGERKIVRLSICLGDDPASQFVESLHHVSPLR